MVQMRPKYETQVFGEHDKNSIEWTDFMAHSRPANPFTDDGLNFASTDDSHANRQHGAETGANNVGVAGDVCPSSLPSSLSPLKVTNVKDTHNTSDSHRIGTPESSNPVHDIASLSGPGTCTNEFFHQLIPPQRRGMTGLAPSPGSHSSPSSARDDALSRQGSTYSGTQSPLSLVSCSSSLSVESLHASSARIAADTVFEPVGTGHIHSRSVDSCNTTPIKAETTPGSLEMVPADDNLRDVRRAVCPSPTLQESGRDHY